MQDEQAWLTVCAPLHGCVFDHDTGIVYDQLRGLVLDGLGWA